MKNLIFSGNTAGKKPILFWAMAIAFVPAQIVHAQSILGSNLIVNGNAEAGSAGTSTSDVVPIPNWTVSAGSPTVLPYGLTRNGAYNPGVQTTDPAPADHGFQYFAATGTCVITQTIDVSSGASVINGGNIEYTVSAYLGTNGNGAGIGVTMAVAFQNAKAQTFSTVTLGPNAGFPGEGMSLQQQIGIVPVGTVSIVVKLTFNNLDGVADSLSLVLNTLSTTPVLGANLVVNDNAEMGPSALPLDQTPALYIPGWSTTGSSVCPYGPGGTAAYSGAEAIQPTDPGPADRGVNFFCYYPSEASVGGSGSYQDIDVSAAASMIDAGQISYQVGAWLGGGNGAELSPTLTYTFYDWTGKQLAPTAQIGPLTVSAEGLVSVSHSDVLPAGTRRVRISLSFPAFSGADDISFSIGNLGAPKITPAGIVPVYSTATTIQPGSWVSIFGSGLASATTTWSGNFPETLGNTSVTIDSKPAYLWFVSPKQINLQAPDDTATGTVNVVVTTEAGSTTSTVTLGQYAPSFSLYNTKYVAAIVPTPGQPGNSGNGYDYIGPGGNGLAFTSRPVKPGETVLLYGVGFGPTTLPVPAGAAFSGAAPVPVLPMVTIGGVQATVSFAGIVEAGLYQLNVVVPSAASGDQALLATIGGVTTPANVLITLQ
jgi:uncharacterized protein (TIGR03437 family)